MCTIDGSEEEITRECFSTQSPTRWRTVHASRLGKTRREIVPVRKHILKKPQTRGPRTSCGYNMFVSEQNKIRFVCIPALLAPNTTYIIIYM